MRLVYKKYADGTYKLYRTDENGRNEQVLEGDVPPDHTVGRVPLFIEVNCDDDRVEDAREGLSLLGKNLSKT